MIGAISTILQHESLKRELKTCDKFAEELEQYQIELECHVQQEFPTRAETELTPIKRRKWWPFLRNFSANDLNLKERFRVSLNRSVIFLRGK